jgi:hypothetical protein
MEEEDLNLVMPTALRRARRIHTVSSVREMAELLMDPLWPSRGPAHRRACDLVLARCENPDGVSVQDLCQAFAAAVDEAEHAAELPIDVDCDRSAQPGSRSGGW